MRKTTKQYHKVAKETYVGGNYIKKIGGNYTIWAESIEYSAGGQIIQTGKEGGVVYGDYVPREEIYTSHPKVEKVEFFDEKDNLLNQNTKDFYYGQKLKIKVTTKDTNDGEIITIRLKGKSKSKNQKFDVMDECRWVFVPVKDNLYETDYFTLNPNWYSDDFENYNYDTHETEIKETDLNEYFAEVNLDAKSVFLPLEGQRLKPITYKRNYEELIGLFKTDNSGEKDLLENYENLYIDKYSNENEDIKDIVDEFSKWMCEDTIKKKTHSIEEIKNYVSESAKKLYENAVWQHKGHINTITITNKETGEKKEEKKERKAILDDRPLYWARNAMQVILKRQYVFIKDILTLPQDLQDLFFKKSIVPKASKLAEVIQLFEVKSRNYAGLNFNSPEANSCKKLLITGFDPFVLDPTKGGNPLQANPSGINALALHNQTIGDYYIQTLVCPVRYADFDEFVDGKGIIEKFIQPFISQVDMIITVSQGSPFRFDVDRFPCKNRGGFADNMKWETGYPEFKQLAEGKGFYETTLPYQKIVPIKNNPTDTFWVYFNQTFEAVGKDYPKENIEGIKKIEEISDDTVQNNCIINSLEELQSLKSISGSGSNYLSNEIFYRVAKLRTELRPNLPTGHLHIPLTQYGTDISDERGNITTKDINPKIKELIEKIKEIITKI